MDIKQEQRKSKRSQLKFRYIDCRFPSEFIAGHIRGAENVWLREQVKALYEDCKEDTVLVFYCEFSSKRAPRAMAYLKQLDREEQFQKGVFTDRLKNVKLLEGGFSKFYRDHPQFCVGTHLAQEHVCKKRAVAEHRTATKSWDYTPSPRVTSEVYPPSIHAHNTLSRASSVTPRAIKKLEFD